MERKHERREFMKLAVAAGTPLALGTSPGRVLERADPVQTDDASFFEAVRTRRSVRRFRPTPVPDFDLTRILDAARLAPTSGNQQP